MSSADDDIPGTSSSATAAAAKTTDYAKKYKRSKSRLSKSSKFTSPSPDRKHNLLHHRSPASLRDRVLLANANAVERALSVSTGDLSDSTTTTNGSSSSTATTSGSSSSSSSGSSSPTPSSEPKPGAIRKPKKKKTKKSKDRRNSRDSVLIGFSGSFPNLSSTQSIDSESERQPSPGDLRTIGASGLGIFPPERYETELAEQQQKHFDSPSASSTISDPNSNATTPTPMQQPISIPTPRPASPSDEQATLTTETTATSSCINLISTTKITPSAIAYSAAKVEELEPKPEVEDQINLPPTSEPDQEHQKENVIPKTEMGEPMEEATPREDHERDKDVLRVRKRCASGGMIQSAEVEGNEDVVGDEEPEQDKQHLQAKRTKISTLPSGCRLSGRSKSFSVASSPERDSDTSRQRSLSEANVSLIDNVNFVNKTQKVEQEQQVVHKEEEEAEAEEQQQQEQEKKPLHPQADKNADEPHAPPSGLSKTKAEETSATVKRSERLSAQQTRRPPTPKLKPTDEHYRLPFAHGWKRELVLPSTDTHRRSGDVFFISPEGRKFRSREDIIPQLKGDLTIDHFCFQRVSQEVGPEFELVRRAVPVNARSQPSFFSSTPAVSGKRVPKPKVPKGASPPPEGWTPTMAVKGNARAIAAAASTNGSNSCSVTHTQSGATSVSSSRKRSAQTSSKHTAAKQQPPPPAAAQLKLSTQGQSQDSSFDNDADNEAEVEDEDGNGSGASMLEISEQMEQPGQLPPAQLLSDNVLSPDTPRWQEIVVIGGRKAIAILDNPPRIPTRRSSPVVPQSVIDGWNSRYDQLYNKRIAGPKKLNQNAILESLGNAHNGCQVLMGIMKTMTLKERANMSHVCKTWAMVSRDRSVWRSVTLRDTYISSWIFCLRELARHRTRNLDMMGMILAKPELRLTGDLRILKSLRVLRTDPSDAEFLHLVFKHLTHLLELRSICTSNLLNLSNLEAMHGLKVLRLHMIDPTAKINSLSAIGQLTNLTELCVRGATNLDEMEIGQLKALTKLETLVLGSCLDVDRVQLGQEVLPALTNLRHFRLENEHKLMDVFPIHDIMQGLAAAGQIKRLELVNVDVDEDFGHLMAKCKNLEELLLMPKCMHNTANMTNAVMQAVSDNADQLRVLRMGLAAQLLSATNYLCKGKDVVPVRRPVPGIPANDHLNFCSDDCYETDHGQCVAYLPMERLESILHHMMPQAWLSVAKIAMRDTTKLQFLNRPDVGKPMTRAQQHQLDQDQMLKEPKPTAP
ncbi:serine-rich adhesin for platelets [Drosophila tropicalis]|uniref:serine-rich adhesin for platelets n=1 Tax=Drosophila tropicalis TaxID=46794 RepID=UPI0035ABB754